MLLLNPASPERFLEQEGGNLCERIARQYLREALKRFGRRGMKVQWGRRDVACGVRGTLGYVEWRGDDSVLVRVPYPDTPYRLEVFLHELGHLWMDHAPEKSCNGRKTGCNPGNREEYEAEQWALDVMRKEGVEIDACILSDAQDNVVDKIFRDTENDLPVDPKALAFVEINDRLKAHGGWQQALEDMKLMKSRNPATREQYRLAQAVLHGTARLPTRMTKRAAQKIIDDTPASLRSRYMRNPAEQAEEVYEEFHGAPSERVTEVSETEHYHSHLAELGILRGLKFRTVDGEDDVTLDFEGEEDDNEEQSGNLFGFGGGQKTSGSSRLLREAFEAGYNGTGGYRGTHEFNEWLADVTADEDLTRAFKKRLRAEYMRGMNNYHKEVEVSRSVGAKHRPSTSAARGAKYATAVARRNCGITTYNPRKKKGPIASASEFVGQMGHGAAAGVDQIFTGRRNPADDDGPVLLCSNESRNQVYFVGGDQSIDLDELEINANHDSVILGECWAIAYSTRKKFDDFEPIEYVHTFGPEDLERKLAKRADLWEDAKPPYPEAFGSGLLPTLRYDCLNQTLHLDGGTYYITKDGIEE